MSGSFCVSFSSLALANWPSIQRADELDYELERNLNVVICPIMRRNRDYLVTALDGLSTTVAQCNASVSGPYAETRSGRFEQQELKALFASKSYLVDLKRLPPNVEVPCLLADISAS